jgi:Serpin (serine protease inhibitor)
MEPNRRRWKSRTACGVVLLAAAGLLGGCGAGTETGAPNPTSPSGVPPSTNAWLPPAVSQALQLQGMSAIDFNNANAALQAALVNPDPHARQLIVDASQRQSRAARFSQVNETYYGAQIGDLAGAPDNVNAWVANATNGLIADILAPMNFALVDAVIVNAIYFKGAWHDLIRPRPLRQPSPS